MNYYKTLEKTALYTTCHFQGDEHLNKLHFKAIASELVISEIQCKLNENLYNPATISLPCL